MPQNRSKNKEKGDKMMKNKYKLRYTLLHRKAFRIVEKQLLGRNTFRSLFHDLDKVFLYPFFNYKTVHNFHNKHARHHELKAHTHSDFVQMVIDWECARYTKPDKPLNARETLYKFYPHLENKILPILNELGL